MVCHLEQNQAKTNFVGVSFESWKQLAKANFLEKSKVSAKMGW